MYSTIMTKVLIIGGGIAGPVAAMALQRAGLEPVLFEAYGRGSDGVGSFLTLAANGLAALDVLDIHLDGIGVATPKMVMVSKGRELASAPMHARTVARAELYQALRDEATRRGIAIEYDRRLVDAARTATGVRATFASGATAEGDLLVGADGLRSRTRTVIDPRAPKPRHVGLLNLSGYASGVSVPGDDGVAYFVFGQRCFFGYFKNPNGDVWWFANPPARREPSREELEGTEKWRSRLVDLFRGDTGPMLAILAATGSCCPRGTRTTSRAYPPGTTTAWS
jgi:2-polyprenyl-6-methoxyphenol hydroxylase-like FAD-dependent oxidoreductase